MSSKKNWAQAPSQKRTLAPAERKAARATAQAVAILPSRERAAGLKIRRGATRKRWGGKRQRHSGNPEALGLARPITRPLVDNQLSLRSAGAQPARAGVRGSGQSDRARLSSATGPRQKSNGTAAENKPPQDELAQARVRTRQLAIPGQAARAAVSERTRRHLGAGGRRSASRTPSRAGPRRARKRVMSGPGAEKQARADTALRDGEQARAGTAR
jgi:hypothetical protein